MQIPMLMRGRAALAAIGVAAMVVALVAGSVALGAGAGRGAGVGAGADVAPAMDAWAALEAALNVTLQEQPKMTLSVAALELLVDGGVRVLYRRDADRPMAIGITGMLFAHAALVELVEERVMRWDTPIAVDYGLRAWPGGEVMEMGEGTVMPVSEWARRMLSSSDNTAAEHLMAVMGRERVEAVVRRVRAAAGRGGPIEPFLTPRELYKLKVNVDGSLLECYAFSGEAERRAMLEGALVRAEVSQVLLENWRMPQMLESVGWIASADELCVLGRLVDERCAGAGMAPGREAWRLPNAEGGDGPWARVCGKLGGEPGALAGVWVLDRRDGRRFVVSVVFNNPTQVVSGWVPVRLIRQTLDAVAQEP